MRRQLDFAGKPPAKARWIGQRIRQCKLKMGNMRRSLIRVQAAPMGDLEPPAPATQQNATNATELFEPS